MATAIIFLSIPRTKYLYPVSSCNFRIVVDNDKFVLNISFRITSSGFVRSRILRIPHYQELDQAMLKDEVTQYFPNTHVPERLSNKNNRQDDFQHLAQLRVDLNQALQVTIRQLFENEMNFHKAPHLYVPF